jgi:hypothetical protein
MLLPTLLGFAALAQGAPQFGGNQGFTMLRFGCAETVIDRIDPLVNPGQAPSPHMHQVAGGNAFNISMASTDISKLATCTTCGYSEDLSNYWTANVYFKARNGTYKRVPQVPNRSGTPMLWISYVSCLLIPGTSSTTSTLERLPVALSCTTYLAARVKLQLSSP